MQHFTLTQDHVRLLRCANITQSDNPYRGAPGMDCKRPFGNSDVIDDMATILGIPPVPTDDEETHWPPGTLDEMLRIYKELGTALQLVMVAGTFEPGEYEADDYRSNWRKV